MRLCLALACAIFGVASLGGLVFAGSITEGTSAVSGARPKQPLRAYARQNSDARKAADSENLLRLELGYVYDIIVPRGSTLSVTVQDASGKTVGECEMKTAADAPPYVMDVPLNVSAVYPLTIHATLQSSLGHKFSDTQQIARAQATAADFVAIDMK
jgi:hypothetical protein